MSYSIKPFARRRRRKAPIVMLLIIVVGVGWYLYRQQREPREAPAWLLEANTLSYPAMEVRAHAHWRSLVEGDLIALTAGYDDDARLTVTFAGATEEVGIGLLAIRRLWEDTLPILSGLDVEIIEYGEEEDSVVAILSFSHRRGAPTRVSQRLHFDGDGRIIEENLEILPDSGSMGDRIEGDS